MLLYNIRDYEDFRLLFGMESRGNGVKSRRNKILLQHLKNPALIKWCREHNDMTLLHPRNMADLKQKVLAYIQQSGKEDRMIKFLASYLKTLPGVKTGHDKYGNLYAWKGESETYPCLVCHIDQVQKIHSKDFKAIETRDIIFGYSASNHQIEGLGADDKNGIFICLEALKKYDCVKTVFFREEETGCKGSSNCEMAFFDDCRYVIQCDRRGNSDFVTSIGYTDLCSERFIRDASPERWGYKEADGMMTDVEILKENGLPVSAINMSCGYYNPHTDEEITVKRDLEKCWRLVQHIIEECTATYPHTPQDYELCYEWEVEEEIHSLLQQDPNLTAADLYDMYHSNFPWMTLDDFERIVEDYRLFYVSEEEDEQTAYDNGDKTYDSEIAL